MANAGVVLTDDLKAKSVDVVHHRYGDEAADVVKKTVDSIDNLNVVKRSYNSVGAKILAKKAARVAVDELLDDDELEAKLKKEQERKTAKQKELEEQAKSEGGGKKQENDPENTPLI
eukprot:UN08925